MQYVVDGSVTVRPSPSIKNLARAPCFRGRNSNHHQDRAKPSTGTPVSDAAFQTRRQKDAGFIPARCLEQLCLKHSASLIHVPSFKGALPRFTCTVTCPSYSYHLPTNTKDALKDGQYYSPLLCTIIQLCISQSVHQPRIQLVTCCLSSFV